MPLQWRKLALCAMFLAYPTSTEAFSAPLGVGTLAHTRMACSGLHRSGCFVPHGDFLAGGRPSLAQRGSSILGQSCPVGRKHLGPSLQRQVATLTYFADWVRAAAPNAALRESSLTARWHANGGLLGADKLHDLMQLPVVLVSSLWESIPLVVIRPRHEFLDASGQFLTVHIFLNIAP